MTPERFRAIVDAYGADSRRWPQAERASAEAWARGHRREADALAAESAWLDACLERHAVAEPGAALVERVLAGAPRRRDARANGARHRRLWWWSGVAFAGVGLAGGFAGALAVSFFAVTGSVPSAAHESPYLSTSFSGSASDWSGE
jgi:hypothetical protein